MTRERVAVCLLLLTTLCLGFLLATNRPLHAAPSSQDDSTECEDLLQTGSSLYQQFRYVEALGKFQAALACFQQAGDRAGEGQALSSVGVIFSIQGRYAEALALLEEALVIHRELGRRADEGWMLDQIGVVYSYQGQYAEALEVFEKAVDIHRQVDNQVLEATTLNNTGWVYDHQGRYREALEVYAEALQIHRELGNRSLEGSTLNNIGMAYYNQGRYAEALADFEEALRIQGAVGDWVNEGVTLSNIGLVYGQQGRYTEALAAFERALTIHRQAGQRREEAATLNNIGAVYDRQGRYADALSFYEQALAIRRDLGVRDEASFTLVNIGISYLNQGRNAEALTALQEALVIQGEVGNPSVVGVILDNIGLVYRAQGQYVEALAAFQEALATHRAIGNLSMAATDLNHIGLIHHAQGRNAEALVAYEEALEIRRGIGDRVGEGATLNDIGGLYYSQGRYGDGLAVFKEALVIHRQVANRLSEAITLNNLGWIYAHQGRFAEALEHYQQAMDVFETVRAAAGSEQGRAVFIAQYAHLYTRAVGLFHEAGRDEEAFYTSERGRARAFLDSLATGQVQLADTAAADLQAREAEAYAARLAAQDALAKASALDQPDPGLVADLEAQLAAAEATHAEVLAAIAARGDQLTQLVPGRGLQNILGVPGVQALLDAETALLAYYLLDEETLAFLITADRFQVFELDVSREELANRVGHLRDLIGFREPSDTRPVAQELYRLLVAPLASSLEKPRLIIVPHGALHYLPFAALLDPETDQYLLQRYSLAVLPSASALPFIKENSLRSASSTLAEWSPLIVGDPASGAFDATASLAVERAGLKRLPYAEEEARAIAALFGAEPLLGAAATEGAVRAGASGAGLLHLAAHGHYNPVAPLSSLVALAPDEAYDGWLTVGEVYGLELGRTDLVVLSACQTQLGTLSAGDELVGLTRAFFYAGTPTVVATLWNVNDVATSALMERFYTGLRAGLGKAEALRQAQLETMADYPDPYYWAAFVLSGDAGAGGQVARLAGEQADQPSTRAGPPTWLWLAIGMGLAALSIAAIATLLWRRRAA